MGLGPQLQGMGPPPQIYGMGPPKAGPPSNQAPPQNIDPNAAKNYTPVGPDGSWRPPPPGWMTPLIGDLKKNPQTAAKLVAAQEKDESLLGKAERFWAGNIAPALASDSENEQAVPSGPTSPPPSGLAPIFNALNIHSDDRPSSDDNSEKHKDKKDKKDKDKKKKKK